MYLRTCELKMRFSSCREIGSWGWWLPARDFFFSKYQLTLMNLLVSKTSYSFSSESQSQGDSERGCLSFSIWLVRMFLRSLMKTSSSLISFSLLSVMYWFSFMKSWVRNPLRSSSFSISSSRANCMLMLSSWQMPSGSLALSAVCCFLQPSTSSKIFFQPYRSTPRIFLPCSISAGSLVSSEKVASSLKRHSLILSHYRLRMASLGTSRKSRLNRQQFWKVSLPG